MTVPTDTTGDVTLVATATVDLALWTMPEGRAEVLLALEEALAGQARQQGRELRDARPLDLHYLKRHQWTDQETGRGREWLEQVVAEDADVVEVCTTARAYRP